MIIKENTKEKIHDAKKATDIIRILLETRQETEQHKEYLYTICLNSNNEIICIDLTGIGTVNSCPVQTREILRIALIKNAVSIIVLHNHPSGNKNASHEDRIFTEKLKNACKHLEIKLLDSIIVTDTEYYSFQEVFDL